jgi:nitrate reductase gamma subunit
MNRLVRISLTLFVSAMILLGLVLMRLKEAAHLTDIARENEKKMAYTGIGMAGVLLVIGVSLLVTAAVRSRKARELHG